VNLLLIIGIGFFLLLVGTLLGRYYAPDRRPLERAAQEGKSYARGLVDLLEGDQDAAISEIANTLKKNTKTVEAYFALGTLFRKRGEHERAVRVHQAILVRRDLDKQTRLQVHHQLALDFRAAGFPKRAIKALEFVIAKDKKRLPAFRELAQLYEEAGEWERAVATHRRIGKLSGEDTSRLQAHMMAEQASRLIEQKELTAARKLLRRAISASPESVHALHVLGLYQQRKGNLAAAAKVWEKALRLAPELAGFFVPRLEVVQFELGKLDSVEKLLRELLEQHSGEEHGHRVQIRLAYARFDARRHPERALAELTALLDEAPNLLPARREAARLVLASGDPDQIRQAFEDLVKLLAKADRGYRCEQCGHIADELFWRCPRCRSWDSVRVAWGRRSGEPGARRARGA
jgi:lipopolysaccharide biosynthesis regulator YciM